MKVCANTLAEQCTELVYESSDVGQTAFKRRDTPWYKCCAGHRAFLRQFSATPSWEFRRERFRTLWRPATRVSYFFSFQYFFFNLFFERHSGVVWRSQGFLFACWLRIVLGGWGGFFVSTCLNEFVVDIAWCIVWHSSKHGFPLRLVFSENWTRATTEPLRLQARCQRSSWDTKLPFTYANCSLLSYV